MFSVSHSHHCASCLVYVESTRDQPRRSTVVTGAMMLTGRQMSSAAKRGCAGGPSPHGLIIADSASVVGMSL